MKPMLLLLLACICCNLSATTYQGITDSKDISLTLKTIPYKKLATMIGDLEPHGRAINHRFSIFKDDMTKAKKTHIAYVATITNNSTQPIRIHKQLVKGVSKMYVDPKEFVKLYKPYIDGFTHHISINRFVLGALAVATIVFCAIPGGGCLLKKMGANISNYDLAPCFLFPALATFVTIPLFSILGIQFTFKKKKLNAKIADAQARMRAFTDYNCLLIKDEKAPLPSGQNRYTIQPGETLIGLLLLDITRGPKDIFERMKPILQYA